MKKLLLLLFLSILVSCNSKKATYFNTDYEHVFHAALTHDKMVFIDMSAVWCGPCQFFEKNIQPDTAFRNFIDKHFYTIKVDGDLKQNEALVKKFKITGYPTFIITGRGGNEIDRIEGLRENTQEKFIELLNNIIQGKEQLQLLEKTYTLHPDSLELLRKIVQEKLYARSLFADARAFAGYAIKNSHNDALKKEAAFYSAYASMQEPELLSPAEMTVFVNEKSNPIAFIEAGDEQLFYFYVKPAMQTVCSIT